MTMSLQYRRNKRRLMEPKLKTKKQARVVILFPFIILKAKGHGKIGLRGTSRDQSPSTPP